MAVVIAVDQSHRTTPKHASIGLALVSFALTTEPYATATGGATLDLSTVLTSLGIAPADIVELSGPPSATGHMPSFAKQATAGQYKVRLWNGATEIADGNITQSFTGRLFYNPGAPT